MDKNKQWIDNLRRQAQGYERKAPEGLLDDIKKEMARRGVMPLTSGSIETSSLPSSKKSGTALTYRLLYLAAAVALAAVLVVTNLPKDGTKQIADVVKKENIKGKQIENAAKNSVNGQLAVSNANGTTSSITSFVRNIFNDIENGGERLVAAITGQDNGSALVAEGSPLVAKNETDDAVATPESSLRSTNPQGSSNKMQKSKRPTYWYEGGSQDITVSTPSHSGFDVALGYTGMGGNSTGMGESFIAEDALLTPPNMLTATIRQAEIENKPEIHHNMPVKLGVSVRYNINNRWSLQSGVNYSYLSSDIYRSSNLQESTSKQKLHYVSVPLSASVSLWHNKNFNVYLTAGGEAAKLVKGKADVNRTVYDGPTTNTTEKIHEHRLQYSVSSSAGVEFKAGDHISVYAEPGVAHYFDNHSSVINIYKDKPTQFTVNVGLRINLNK